MRGFRFSIIMSCLCMCVSVVSAKTVYVDDSAIGGLENGTDWEDAYLTIQAGIDNADPYDTVLVAVGDYIENLDLGSKELVLTGTDPNDISIVNATLIDGGGVGSVITCTSNQTSDTVISGLRIFNGAADVYGAGIYCNGVSPIIKNCVFDSNIGNTSLNSWGGGIMCWQGAPTITGCRFYGNTTGNYGGGICCYNSNAVIESCAFSGNGVGCQRGGAISCYLGTPTIENCTLSKNTSDYGGGIYLNNCNAIIDNCIVWDNYASIQDDEVYTKSCTPVLSCSVIKNGWTGAGSNNYSADPLIIDADGENDMAGDSDDVLYLDGYSYCINAGTAVSFAGQTDVDGYNRVLYDQVDIGAFEIFPIGSDLSEDEQVDVADLILFADGGTWLVTDNLEDFAIFASQWLWGVD